MSSKKCQVCKKDKDIEEFRRQTGLKDKFNKICASCVAPVKARYEAKKEDIQKYQLMYRKEHKEYFDAYRARWNQENRSLNRAYKNRKYDTDIHFKKKTLTRQLLRGLINKAFEFEMVLGCTFVEFKAHIESRFEEGMSWANYGKNKGCWSLDHVVALENAPEGFNVNHYTNLQPLWIEENSRKADLAWPEGNTSLT